MLLECIYSVKSSKDKKEPDMSKHLTGGALLIWSMGSTKEHGKIEINQLLTWTNIATN